MRSGRSDPSVRPRTDDGFTIIESMVAVTILAVAIVLSIQPVMAALRGVSDARVISVAENLAQAEVEVIRSLSYEEIGLPGRTPSGTLTAEREIVVEGRRYVLEIDVQYAGSVTGLDVIPQGGDGVEGSWDPGVDYKVASITVTADGRESDPIVMQTIIAPTRVGQHEGIANARVLLDAHEPFAKSALDLPVLKVQAPPAGPISSGMSADQQVWPAIPPATYTVTVGSGDNGWILHPDDVINGLDQLVVVAGTTVQTTLRVFRPATLELKVIDVATEAPIPNARLTLTDTDLGTATAYAQGEYTVSNLMPNTYDVLVTAPGYEDWLLTSLNIPGNYPDPLHRLTAYLTAFGSGGSTTTTTIGSSSTSSTTTSTLPSGNRVPVDFIVIDNRGMPVAGAHVDVTHASDGPFSGITDRFGGITFNLLDGERYEAVGSTLWGHAPDTDRLDVGGPVDALEVGRGRGRGTMTLSGGEDAEFLFRSSSSQQWTVMPANYRGMASFVGQSGYYEIGKRCLANGEVLGVRQVYVKKDSNRETTVYGWCPPS